MPDPDYKPNVINIEGILLAYKEGKHAYHEGKRSTRVIYSVIRKE